MCEVFILVSGCIYTFIVSILWITVIYACYIIAFKNKKEKLSKKAQILHIIFVITSVFAIGYYPFLRWDEYCTNKQYIAIIYSPILINIWDWCFKIQFVSLGVLFLMKIIFIFDSTMFEISKWIINIYITITIIGTIGVIILGFLAIFHLWSIYFIILALLQLIFLFFMISLTVLFIRKLIIVYKNAHIAPPGSPRSQSSGDNDMSNTVNSNSDAGQNNHDKGPPMVRVITKLTILISLSLIMTLLSMIINLFHVFTQTQITRLMAQTFGVIDLYTNFMCAVLTYKCFDHHYDKICSLLHRKCMKCCMNMIHGDDNSIKLSQIVNTKSDASITSV